MSLSAKEAADLVGMSKTGIIKAMRQGKISAQKDLKGEWRVEPIELFRVYDPIGKDGDKPAEASSPPGERQDTESLQVKIEQMERRLVEKDDTIHDLRQRLDAEAQERRQLVLVLTAERHENDKQVSWWRRLFGSG